MIATAIRYYHSSFHIAEDINIADDIRLCMYARKVDFCSFQAPVMRRYGRSMTGMPHFVAATCAARSRFMDGLYDDPQLSCVDHSAPSAEGRNRAGKAERRMCEGRSGVIQVVQSG